MSMAWSDETTHPVSGATVPRCQLRPTAQDIQDRPELGAHVWECGNPTGHQGWANVQGDRDLTEFHAHSWTNTGD
jgi:hypothetical protein